jgi:hypothetical protein
VLFGLTGFLGYLTLRVTPWATSAEVGFALLVVVCVISLWAARLLGISPDDLSRLVRLGRPRRR